MTIKEAKDNLKRVMVDWDSYSDDNGFNLYCAAEKLLEVLDQKNKQKPIKRKYSSKKKIKE